MDVSVIIPARDAAATLPATLAALAQQTTTAEVEVIVVDDGSSDGTRDVVEQAPLDVTLVEGAGEGPAAARNRGAAVARGRLLAFTDADCIPTPQWLEHALAAARDADLVQGKVLPPPGTAVGPFDRMLAVVGEYGLYETANLVVDRELFERLGGFQSILRPRNGKELGEDVWLGWRARRAGARTTFSEDALVHHVVFPRGPVGYVAERARLRFFPELVARVPELRSAFIHRRYFLNRRTAAFDLALVGALAAAARRDPKLLALAAPYANELRTAARARPRQRLEVTAVGIAADAVSCAALVAGSLRARTPLL